ncbi:zf-HC2 domain-containing protein [Phenylobacterium sp.]|jgi:anti-sigma factor RsiW|uniref:zf-HC2 domain-containing protein n=1 Tax=Phenylobacterium sp. TaxID=1871053 RepID=UPI0037840014
MARVIPLRPPDHQELRLLLPWYATGRLTELERARLEAHLATCADCRAELQTDRRLHAAVATMPYDADAGWLRLRARMAKPNVGTVRRLLEAGLQAPGWVRWALAGQAAVAATGVMFVGLRSPAPYETLSAPARLPSAEIIIVFHPETPERRLRAILNAADVRLVGGPTAADAYLLDAGKDGSDAALAKLRGRPEVVMAEPLQRDVPSREGAK